MNNIENNTKGNKKSRKALRVVVSVVCCMALVFGSYIAGIKVTEKQLVAMADNDVMQAYNATEGSSKNDDGSTRSYENRKPGLSGLLDLFGMTNPDDRIGLQDDLDATGASSGIDSPDSLDGSDSSGLSDSLGVFDSSGVSGSSSAPDNSGVPGSSGAPDNTDVSGSLGAFDSFDVSDSSGASDNYSVANSSIAAEVTETASSSDESGDVAQLGRVNPSGETLSLVDLFIGANPAVVAISTEMTGRNVFGRTVTLPAAGSGFIISSDGYIVTNNHVIENASSISILMYDGDEFPATLVGRDPDSDIALLKIDVSNLSYLSWGDSGSSKVGEQIAAIGNPLGEFANSMTVGYISALDREINIDGIPRRMFQTDAAVNEGNSGGPLLNLKGQVIGIVSAKSSGISVEGLGFAIPSNTAKSITEQLIQNGYVKGRAVMGVQVGAENNDGQQRVYVESVNPGSAAEKAGVKAGDIILSADGTEVSTIEELKNIINSFSPGDKLDLRVLRDKNESSLTVILDEYKPDLTLTPPSTQATPPSAPSSGDSQTPDQPRMRQQFPFDSRNMIPDFEEMFPSIGDLFPSDE